MPRAHHSNIIIFFCEWKHKQHNKIVCILPKKIRNDRKHDLSIFYKKISEPIAVGEPTTAAVAAATTTTGTASEIIVAAVAAKSSGILSSPRAPEFFNNFIESFVPCSVTDATATALSSKLTNLLCSNKVALFCCCFCRTLLSSSSSSSSLVAIGSAVAAVATANGCGAFRLADDKSICNSIDGDGAEAVDGDEHKLDGKPVLYNLDK